MDVEAGVIQMGREMNIRQEETRAQCSQPEGDWGNSQLKQSEEEVNLKQAKQAVSLRIHFEEAVWEQAGPFGLSIGREKNSLFDVYSASLNFCINPIYTSQFFLINTN